MYDKDTILQYIEEEDVKFIRLTFSDIFGNIKNVSIMPYELERAIEHGISIDAHAINGFGGEEKSDLFIFPNLDTIGILPWRPSQGRVVRMFCDIKYPDGTPFECDSRKILEDAVKKAADMGVEFKFGSEMEFYLFKLDELGNKTNIPYDYAGYMDVAPDDLCENIRREICLTLEEMEIIPESSHHEEGPGQNEIDFRYSDPIKAADNAVAFKNVVRTIAHRNGLYASFDPKPLKNNPGNGYHINFSVNDTKLHKSMISGVLKNIKDMTAFLNPTTSSYERIGSFSAPSFICWSSENRNTLIRIPAAKGIYQRAELRSPDSAINPYIAFALVIYAALEGISGSYSLPDEANLKYGDSTDLYDTLPANLETAKEIALNSKFISKYLPKKFIDEYLK